MIHFCVDWIHLFQDKNLKEILYEKLMNALRLTSSGELWY
jgi:hypothetical protein